MRTIIIGDIHGCFAEWMCLLQKVQFNPENDRLILLGDLIDRGKDSYSVYKKAVSLCEEMKERCIILRGSHEKMLLDNSRKIKDRFLWNLVGKRTSIRSFIQNGESLYDNTKWFAENTVLYYETDTFRCVHAAIRHENLSKNDEHTLLINHSLTRKNLYNGKLTITGHIHLKEPTWYDGSGGKGQKLPYHCYMPLPDNGIICLDTGCAEGNKLTAMVIQDNSYFLEYVYAI